MCVLLYDVKCLGIINDYHAKYIIREIRNDGQAEKMKIDCGSLDVPKEKITLI